MQEQGAAKPRPYSSLNGGLFSVPEHLGYPSRMLHGGLVAMAIWALKLGRRGIRDCGSMPHTSQKGEQAVLQQVVHGVRMGH